MAHTPAPWKWHTSNSWKRLKRDDHGVTQNVLEPYVCKDGHPDVSCSAEDMRVIEVAPELLAMLKNITENFNMTRLLMKDNETRKLAAEIVSESRALIAK